MGRRHYPKRPWYGESVKIRGSLKNVYVFGIRTADPPGRNLQPDASLCVLDLLDRDSRATLQDGIATR